MYSQNNEEQIAVEFFGSFVGRVLDVGAFDGIEMSNSRALIERGWSAVLVEPACHNMEKLIFNNAKFSDRVILVQAAVASTSGISRLYMDMVPDRRWSTTINKDLVDFGSVMKVNPLQVYVPTIRLDDLIQFGPYHFISIDAEWEDMEILKKMPTLLLEQCRLICMESRNTEERTRMRAILSELGFSTLHETPENLMVSRN